MRAHLWSQVSLTHNQVHVWLHILFYATVEPAAHGTSEDSSTAAATDPFPFSSACNNQASDRNTAYRDQLQKPVSLCKDRHMKCSSVLRTVDNTWKVRSSIHAHLYRGSHPRLWSSCKTCIAAAPSQGAAARMPNARNLTRRTL